MKIILEFSNPFNVESYSWSKYFEMYQTTRPVTPEAVPFITWSITLGFRRYWFDYQNEMNAHWLTIAGFTAKYYKAKTF